MRNTGWVRNPIDPFILARLEKEGVQPSPEADKHTLLRRLSLDLIGLPPSPDQIAKFISDTSPDAYERAVERLLNSPHYGEKWARHWLDQARYADSDGFRGDRFRPYAWRYRHWVIDALNADMPFDQFTIEQIAGDLLPNATSRRSRDRLPSQHADQPRRRHRSGAVPRRAGDRPHEHRRNGLARSDGRLRAMPRPQVRSDLAKGLLPPLRLLQQCGGDQHRGAAGRARWVRICGAGPSTTAKRKSCSTNIGVPELQADWEKRMFEAAANPGKWLDWDHAFDDLRTDLEWGEKILQDAASKAHAQAEQKSLTDYFLANYHRVITKEQQRS